MKKNKMMRLASCLLVAVMLSTSVISGTFAKYVAKGEATDSARVAKWGVTVAVEGKDAFAKEYAKTDTSFAGDLTVESTEKVIAPGTNGTLGTVAVTSEGTEVAVRVAVESIELELGDNWVVDGAVYCPLVFTVDGEEIAIDGTNIASVDELEQEVEDAISTYLNKDYAVGDTFADKLELGWAWEFEAGENNVKDTALGDAANATIKFALTVSATQID